MSSPTPVATGTLGTTPLSQLLIYALERSLSGSLVLQSGVEDSESFVKCALTLGRGVVVKARVPKAETALGQVCVELGFVDARDVQETLRQERNRLFGEHLYDLGLLERDQLNSALLEQLYRQLEWIAVLPADARYGYYEGHDFLQTWGGHNLDSDPLAAIGRVARRTPLSTAVTERVIASLSELTLQLHPHARVGRFELNASQRTVLDVLRAKPQSYAELLATELLEEAELKALLSLLALTKHLQLGDGFPLGVTVGQSLSPLMVPRATPRKNLLSVGDADDVPSSRSGALAQDTRRDEILARASTLEGSDLYALLEVEPDAEAATIQAAFLRQAKTWHPDRIPPELADLKGVVTRVFTRMTEAHQTLSQPKHRAEYDKLRASGSNSDEEQRKVQAVLRAAAAFQKAEVLARRGDWRGAEPLARQAHEGDPEQAEYAALHAWIIARSGQRTSHEQFDDLLTTLSKAVKQQRNNVNVRLYRAAVLKLAGRLNEAMRDYRAVAELDPANVEAQRELRLHRMRKESNPPAQGVLRRLFKKER